MTLRNLVAQIHRSIGDGGAKIISRETVLEALTDEMRYACKLFPVMLYVDLENQDFGSGVGQDVYGNIQPERVIIDNVEALKSYPSIVASNPNGSPADRFIWCLEEGKIKISPDPTDAKIVGEMYNERYTLDHIDCSLSETSVAFSAGRTEVTGHTGLPLTVVRYRVAQRLSEETGMFDRAQYFLAVADKREKECRRLWDDQTTSSVGYPTGGDFF